MNSFTVCIFLSCSTNIISDFHLSSILEILYNSETVKTTRRKGTVGTNLAQLSDSLSSAVFAIQHIKKEKSKRVVRNYIFYMKDV